MTALIVLSSIFTYLTMIGVVMPKSIDWLYNGRPNFSYRSDAKFLGAILGIFWPAFLPVALGVLISSLELSPAKRIEKRHDKQVEEAQHKQRLARINAETIAIKEREAGIK